MVYMSKRSKHRTITSRGVISKETLAAAKGAAGLERAAFFAAGGTPAMWNGGRAATFDSKSPKARARRECRQPITY